jgi:hypothetical protein
LISSRNSSPGGWPAAGRKAGGHHTAWPLLIAEMPRRSVGSSSEARRSITVRSAAAAMSRTIELLPTPGAAQTKAGQHRPRLAVDHEAARRRSRPASPQANRRLDPIDHQTGLGGSNDSKATEFTAAHIASVLALAPAHHPPSRIDAPTAGAIA